MRKKKGGLRLIIFVLRGGVEMENLKIAVLAMRKKEVEKLPEEVRNIIKDDVYSDIPEKWKPFIDQTSEINETIEDLIKDVEGAKSDIRFFFQSDLLINEKFETLEDLSIQKKIANLKLRKEYILYIIDYLSLEIKWIADIVREIEKFSNIGCLMPINVKYPTHLQNRMSELRDNNLLYISKDCKDSDVVEEVLVEEVLTIVNFQRRLREIARVLVKKRIRVQGKGKATPSSASSAYEAMNGEDIPHPKKELQLE